MTTDVLKTWVAVKPTLEPYLTPIKDEPQYRAALELLEVLWDVIPEGAETPYDTLFNGLVDHIEAYETAHYPIPEASPDKLLAFLLEQKGVTQKAVEAATGIHQSNLSQIMNGKRKLTGEQIKSLAAYFNVEVSAFF